MIDMDTRVRAARGIAKTETEAAQEAFETLKARGHPHAPPPTVSDGRGGIPQAMVEVWGQVPAYCGRGRPPTRKRAQEGWIYLKIIKRHKNGAVVRTHKQVVYGPEENVLDLFGASTAYVERTHLTSRQFNGRLVRKTLGFSKDLDMHRASAIWEDAIYNLVRPLKTLRVRVQGDASRRWLPRTPAMASGMTDHIWTIRELLTRLPVPSPNTS
jgi:hypothetical protein